MQGAVVGVLPRGAGLGMMALVGGVGSVAAACWVGNGGCCVVGIVVSVGEMRDEGKEGDSSIGRGNLILRSTETERY